MPGQTDAANLLNELDQSLRAALAPAQALQRLLRAALKAGPNVSLAELRKLQAELGAKEALLKSLGITAVGAAVDGLRAAIAERVQSRRLSFSKELREACKRVQVEPRRVAEDPEEWRLGLLTLVVDFEKDTGELRYARLPVAQDVPLSSDLLFQSWNRARSSLEKGSVAPDRLIDALDSAYRALLATTQKPIGERVPLVELLSGVALAVQSDSFRRSPTASTFRDYARPQFAYDLARVRRERRLVHKGYRVDLGTAVGNATADKKQVLWLEDESGTGQYYLFFRCLPHKEAEPSEPQSNEAPHGKHNAG